MHSKRFAKFWKLLEGTLKVVLDLRWYLAWKVWELLVSLIPSSSEYMKSKEGVNISCLSVSPSIPVQIKTSLFCLWLSACINRIPSVLTHSCRQTYDRWAYWDVSHEGDYWELNERSSTHTDLQSRDSETEFQSEDVHYYKK